MMLLLCVKAPEMRDKVVALLPGFGTRINRLGKNGIASQEITCSLSADSSCWPEVHRAMEINCEYQIWIHTGTTAVVATEKGAALQCLFRKLRKVE